jgi:hypothetical protein
LATTAPVTEATMATTSTKADAARPKAAWAPAAGTANQMNNVVADSSNTVTGAAILMIAHGRAHALCRGTRTTNLDVTGATPQRPLASPTSAMANPGTATASLSRNDHGLLSQD